METKAAGLYNNSLGSEGLIQKAEFIVREPGRLIAAFRGVGIKITAAKKATTEIRHRQRGGPQLFDTRVMIGGGGPGVVDDEDSQRNQGGGQQEERGARNREEGGAHHAAPARRRPP